MTSVVLVREMMVEVPGRGGLVGEHPKGIGTNQST